MKGYLESPLEKIGASKQGRKLKIDGDFYSVWDKGLVEASEAAAGGEVEFEWEPSGKERQYRKITSLAPVKGAAPTRSHAGAAAKDILIAKESALKSACDAFARVQTANPADKIVLITEAYTHFEALLLGEEQEQLEAKAVTADQIADALVAKLSNREPGEEG